MGNFYPSTVMDSAVMSFCISGIFHKLGNIYSKSVGDNNLEGNASELLAYFRNNTAYVEPW